MGPAARIENSRVVDCMELIRVGPSEVIRLPRVLFPKFWEAALGNALTAYFEPRDFSGKWITKRTFVIAVIIEPLGDAQKVFTDQEDFLSLSAFGVNGYTQRHKDRNDSAAEVAGLCTPGWHANSFGPRFFMIATGHNNVKEHVRRKLGKLPELPPVSNKRRDFSEDGKDKNMETTCTNRQ
ncbi:hypothetical protein DL764_000150 [Monosporascus ibericus]|uniref:Uncharacterized protein n=1 Tax=Monosporascus ibericus TaxID=155417 RepID=A0A4Q4TWK2_9PEZI|nr:hypothetical protein DL764_000150 [Monosporascus ibericus]